MSAIRNPNLGPSQMRARRRRLFFVRFYIILFFVTLFVLILAIYSGNEKMKIKQIIITGNAAVTENEILNIVKQDLQGRYWYLFSRSNYLIFPRFKIKQDILSQLKTVKEVNVSWNNWQVIFISVTERRPHSVWCGEDPALVDYQCYFVDNTGYIYKLAPTFTGHVYIRNYGKLIPDQLNNVSQINPIGSYFLPKETYLQVFNLISVLDDKNIIVNSSYFDGADFRFVLDSGPEIIFNNKNSFSQSFTNLFSAIDTGNLDLAKDSGVIKYLDLRFDNKVVIGKKQNEN